MGLNTIVIDLTNSSQNNINVIHTYDIEEKMKENALGQFTVHELTNVNQELLDGVWMSYRKEVENE